MSITDFGAVPGIDSTSAIQAAIDAAQPGDTVWFPAGEYTVSIQANYSALVMRSGVTYAGVPGQSVVKLAAGQGNYVAMFTSNTQSMANVRVEGLTFDMNNTENAIPYPDDATWRQDRVGGRFPARYTLDFVRTNDLTVTRCTFRDVDCFNAVIVRDEQSSGIVITDNTFGGVGDSPIYHDCSLIHVTASDMTIAGNAFYGAYVGAGGARAIIETHGSNQAVYDNTATDFEIGIIITGIANRSEHIRVHHNALTVATAIWLYSRGTGLVDVDIYENVLRLQPGWTRSPADFVYPPSNDAPILDLQIYDNTVIEL